METRQGSRTGRRDGTHPGPRGWRFAPEGAALHAATATAVIADVHLGYEWARAATGDVVPEHTLADTLRRLESMLGRGRFSRLVIAGDLVEPFGICPRTSRDVATLRRWLAGRGVELQGVRGDHDRTARLPETLEVGTWTVAHGSRPVDARRAIGGHFHPALRCEGRSFPCFLFDARRIVLPAFSPNASGLDVRSAGTPADWASLRCVAAAGGDWLDFGPLAGLPR